MPAPLVIEQFDVVEQGFLRMADVEMNSYYPAFRPLRDLLAARYPESAVLKAETSLTDRENGSFKNYDVRVTAQDSRFEASLVPEKSGCGLAFFIDERILIYTGVGLGCPQMR